MGVFRQLGRKILGGEKTIKVNRTRPMTPIEQAGGTLGSLQKRAAMLDWDKTAGKRGKSAYSELVRKGRMNTTSSIDELMGDTRKVNRELSYYPENMKTANTDAMVASYSKVRNRPSSALEGQKGFISEAFGFADDPYGKGYKGGRKFKGQDSDYLTGKTKKTDVDDLAGMKEIRRKV
tara:strand:- start:3650 stop:4183 length:534 start_codon:yes stop_codon:yes gene_type:complete